MTGARAVIAAASFFLLLGVTACSGDDPEPRLAPPSSAAPTSPSSPSTTAASMPVEPTMPAAAKGTDAAAAEAFVKFYWEMVNYAQATGETDGLAAITDDGCTACAAGLQAIRRVSRNGGVVIGGVNSVRRVRSAPLDEGKRRTVWFDLSNTRQVIHYGAGRDDDVYAADTVTVMSVLRKHHGRWTLEYWGKDR